MQTYQQDTEKDVSLTQNFIKRQRSAHSLITSHRHPLAAPVTEPPCKAEHCQRTTCVPEVTLQMFCILMLICAFLRAMRVSALLLATCCRIKALLCTRCRIANEFCLWLNIGARTICKICRVRPQDALRHSQHLQILDRTGVTMRWPRWLNLRGSLSTFCSTLGKRFQN